MNKDYSVQIMTFEKFEGKENIGSSMIRARWLANNWDEASIYSSGKKSDVMIYQKTYWIDHAKIFDGIKIFDTCDPDWLHWGYKTKEMIDLCDAVTTSTEELAKAIRKFTKKPVFCVPDRLDLNNFRARKVHTGKAKTALWYGYHHNTALLKPVIPFLEKNDLNLIVLSNQDFILPSHHKIEVENLRYKQETANSNIVKGDFVINPVASNGKWRFKSNNKTIIAWALGVPVVETPKDIEKFMSADERIKEIVKRQDEIREKWDIKISVNQYKEIINEINNKVKKVNIN